MIDRKQIKANARSLTRSAQIPAVAMTAAILGIGLLLSLIDTLVSGDTYETLFAAGLPGLFVSILVMLILFVLQAGYVLYCLAVHRGERSELLTLFDGFSFVGKIILLYLLEYLFVMLWTMLFVIPGFIALYRYRFAIYNLCENPSISPSEAIRMSKVQTQGYKGSLFALDLSFIGWGMLSMLPYGIVNGLVAGGMQLPAPALVVTLVCGVLSGLVDLWRMPYQTLSEVGYFTACKQISGVGFGAGAPLPLDEGDDSFRSF